ncbi:MAG: hypothetical protein IAC55_05680 [Tyzzerella sp.]|uniref:Uncharacterized protein n=1 Tax=Candidatus Fimicola merdigallinarum TaxID=2840819 RepID=A0A9D9DYF4_9FIRM|nr:hypothetical protein [Candidatus Fimicola merdigallinarum]
MARDIEKYIDEGMYVLSTVGQVFKIFRGVRFTSKIFRRKTRKVKVRKVRKKSKFIKNFIYVAKKDFKFMRRFLFIVKDRFY